MRPLFLSYALDKQPGRHASHLGLYGLRGCPSAIPPRISVGLRRLGHRGPQGREATHAGDEHEHGGETEEQGVQWPHWGDLLSWLGHVQDRRQRQCLQRRLSCVSPVNSPGRLLGFSGTCFSFFLIDCMCNKTSLFCGQTFFLRARGCPNWGAFREYAWRGMGQRRFCGQVRARSEVKGDEKSVRFSGVRRGPSLPSSHHPCIGGSSHRSLRPLKLPARPGPMATFARLPSILEPRGFLPAPTINL